LKRFAERFSEDIFTVTTADVQMFLDGLKLGKQSKKNFRTVLGTLFSFAEARGYLLKGSNPVLGTEEVKVKSNPPHFSTAAYTQISQIPSDASDFILLA